MWACRVLRMMEVRATEGVGSSQVREGLGAMVRSQRWLVAISGF